MFRVVWALGLAKIIICVFITAWPKQTNVLAQRLANSGEKVYTNGWAIRVEGGIESAKRIARSHGFEKVEPIGTLEGFYHLEHAEEPHRSRRSAEERTGKLMQDPKVIWAEQQHEKIRVKRGHFHDRMIARGIVPRFSDPLWDAQWYLDDKRADQDLDVHVLPVWNQGITGKGVVVTILDDGIEHNHTDLIRNYDPQASWDVNGEDGDPFPRYDPTNENKHGTRCAGEVAAQANNTICGVGVAYNAKIGGVRMLDGRVTDKVEAASLSLNPQFIDIYSASWGPSDDGATVEGPGTLAAAAFENGITKGRGGLGSIFVWASGNGGRHEDSCNCDGYTDSIYTLSISSASDHGESPWYSESCSSTLATTFSSGAHGEKRIVTTDLHNECTERHTGTSASAPLAAGIIALALEVNPRLTWRDVQHIVVWTSNWEPLKHDQDWSPNGVGLHVNRKFGFGLLVAEKIIELAKPTTFKTVPEKTICRGQINQDRKPIKFNEPLKITMHSNGCSGTAAEIRYLEHVQILLSLDYTRRGDLVVYLTSPMGTKSCLLSPRKEDLSDEGFTKWPFMTTHSWGEDPRGTWTIEIKDLGDNRPNHGLLTEWQLILHGTKQKPNHQPIEHPDKPRDSVPVPDSPAPPQFHQVPSGPTYTFASPSTAPVKYISPQVVTYTTSSAPNPAVLTLAAQPIVPLHEAQKQPSSAFMSNNKQTGQTQSTFGGQQTNLAQINPEEAIYSPIQSLHNNFVPADYHQNQIANYYHYVAPGNPRGYIPQVNPAVPQTNDQLGYQQITNWRPATAYRNPLQYNTYSNYLRTLGRRGAGRSYVEYLKTKKNKLKKGS
ncbi:LOW QUALITY PROTEIN: neuroendocrine convertase 1-like [Oculina patagonica]